MPRNPTGFGSFGSLGARGSLGSFAARERDAGFFLAAGFLVEGFLDDG
jgi:hypothetical protein